MKPGFDYFTASIKIIHKECLDQNLNTNKSCNISIINANRPQVLIKLNHTAWTKAILKKCGIDTVLSVQEFKYSLMAVG
jgi:hypothetical protein